MVLPPDIDQLMKETARQEEIEKNNLPRDENLLSELSRARIQEKAEIPEQLEKGHYALAGIKKYFAFTE